MRALQHIPVLRKYNSSHTTVVHRELNWINAFDLDCLPHAVDCSVPKGRGSQHLMGPLFAQIKLTSFSILYLKTGWPYLIMCLNQ